LFHTFPFLAIFFTLWTDTKYFSLSGVDTKELYKLIKISGNGVLERQAEWKIRESNMRSNDERDEKFFMHHQNGTIVLG
jgi:hypothetical protein